MAKLSILTWKWKSDPAHRTQFTARDVNIMFSMLKRHTTIPFDFYCVTDDPAGLKPGITPYPLWNEPLGAEVNCPRKPNCYRRLKQFSDWARVEFGPRILSIDLDMIITANIDDILSRKEDFIAWNKGEIAYQGGFILHSPGTRTFLWDDFHPVKSPAKAAHLCGSDQAWISYRLPPGEAVFTPKDGIVSFKKHIRQEKYRPGIHRIIVFHGDPKPSELVNGPRYKFVKEHWR